MKCAYARQIDAFELWVYRKAFMGYFGHHNTEHMRRYLMTSKTKVRLRTTINKNAIKSKNHLKILKNMIAIKFFLPVSLILFSHLFRACNLFISELSSRNKREHFWIVVIGIIKYFFLLLRIEVNFSYVCHKCRK